MQNSVAPACSGIPAVFVPAVFVTLLVVSFSLLPVHFARAQDSPEDDRLTILITASRLAETVDETLAPVTVITRKEIEEKQATTVEEVLRSVPGVTLSNSGGVGQQTSLFLRGTESNHVLVLIDGIKVGNATSGSTPFEGLPLDQIEKIEVVRGPRSSLYGSEAIGGVIQIFTRKHYGEPRPTFTLGIGSHNARKINLGVSGGGGGGWYHFGLSHNETDGFDACRGRTSPFAGCGLSQDGLQKDSDGYENNSFSMRSGVSLSDAFSIEGNILNSENQTEFDGSYQNESETVTQLASIKAILQTSGRWRSSLLLGQSKDKADNFLDGAPASRFDTTRDQITWQNNFRLNENSRLVAGVDYLDDKVASTTDYEVDTRDNVGAFVSLRIINANDVELSLRNDDNEQFGDKTTGSIGWGRDFDNGDRITASYGTAFTVPTFNDLYDPWTGNPDLKPESAQSFDLGFSQRNNNSRLTINFYRTTIDDMLVLDENYRPLNINKAEITGVELASHASVDAWDLAASVTHQNPKDAGGSDTDGNLLPRRAKTILNLDAARQVGKYRLGAALFVTGQSYDDAANTRRIPGYSTLNLRGQARLHKNWLFTLALNNVTDQEYETVSYYNQDGFNIMATLRYVPATGR